LTCKCFLALDDNTLSQIKFDVTLNPPADNAAPSIAITTGVAITFVNRATPAAPNPTVATSNPYDIPDNTLIHL
jgi:hypothetical protein